MTVALPGQSAAQPRNGLLLIALLSLTWGLAWPAFRVVLAEMPVWNFRAFCLALAAVSFFVIARLAGHRLRLRRGELGALALMALFNSLGWHLLSAYGVQLIGAGKASILGFTMPLWAALLSALLLKEPLRRTTLAGLVLGLAGVAVLLWGDAEILARSPWGVVAMLAAAVCWAMGTVLMKRSRSDLSVVALAAWQFALAAPVLAVGAWAVEGPVELASISLTAWLVLVYIIFIGLVLPQIVWFRIIRLYPAAVAALSTLAIPVVAVLSAALLIGEPLGWTQLLALLLVAGSLAVVLVLPALQWRRPRLPLPPTS